jgi:hypothetical protein
MKELLVIIIPAFIVIFLAIIFAVTKPTGLGINLIPQLDVSPSPAVTHSDISIDAPLSNTVVTSPITISGKAKGFWFFEATFPVQLKDANGLVIAESFATAQGEWMTEEFVPFTATIKFVKPTESKTGTLVFKKANASGLPENDDSFEVPVRFE